MASRVADKVVLRIVAIIVVIFFLGPFLLRSSVVGHGIGLLVVIAVLVGRCWSCADRGEARPRAYRCTKAGLESQPARKPGTPL
jgi:hypothetical protein